MSTVHKVSQVGLGDVELVIRVRAADTAAYEPLLERHRDAVADLGPSEGFESVESSGQVSLALVRNGLAKDLPFRATWLAMHAQGTLPTSEARNNAAWDAFCALPAAWQVAVWHREVEGESAEEIAYHLGTTPEGAERALTAAHSSLARRVALGHAGKPMSAECEQIQGKYRFGAPAQLTKTSSRALRRHGRNCSSCQPMVSQLLVLEHTLRDTLADVVLGASATRYLELRRRPTRLRAVGGSAVRDSGAGTGQGWTMPIFTGLTAVAAAVTILLVPALSPLTSSPDEVVPVAQAPIAGEVIEPLVVTPTQPEPSGGAPTGSGAAPSSAPAAATPTPSTPAPAGPSGGGQPGSNPGGKPGNGGGNPVGPDGPSDPGADGPVSIESGPDSTTVTVDTGVIDPVVVEVPLGTGKGNGNGTAVGHDKSKAQGQATGHTKASKKPKAQKAHKPKKPKKPKKH